MSFFPYKVTAIKRLDSTGLNVLPLASVSILTTGGAFATLREADLITPVGNPFDCDNNGERQVWIAPGSYVASVAGGQSWNFDIRPDNYIQSVATIAALTALTGVVAEQQFSVNEYNSGTGKGGGQFVAKAGVATANNVTTFASATAGVYFERANTVINSDHAGAKGDGVDDTAAINRFRIYCQTSGAEMIFTAGNFVSTTDASVFFTSAVVMRGAGMGKTILTAADGAGLTNFVTFTGTSGRMQVLHLTIDGNRAGGGTLPENGYGLYLSGYDALIQNVEIRNSAFAGAFTGSTAGTSRAHTFDNCWIHSNGATVTGPFRNGVGIYGGGSTPVDHLTVTNCLIENNYCIDTFPGDSTAINAVVRKATIICNDFRNNYNVNGGQVAVTDGGSGGQKIDSIISGNIFDLVGSFGGDKTGAIEINGCDVVCTGNIVKRCNQSAVVIEGDSSRVVVGDNILYATETDGSGVNVITSGGTGGTDINIHHNKIFSGFNGLSCQSGYTNVIATDNQIAAAVINKISGEANFKILRGNDGYGPANQDITAGGSPWTSTALPWDCLVVIKTVNGLSALSFGGAPLPITVGTSFFVKAQRQFIATWSGSAPEFSYIQQQR